MAQSRILATSMFADIVGYTDLMQRDEAHAMRKLDKFKSALELEIPKFNGEIIQYFGDGCLAIFNSALDAISCTRKLQQNWGHEVEVPVRIGLHLGDVIRKDDNVYGDSVNLASRIESMGIPNSILVSESVRRSVKNQPDLQFEALGTYEFKNVHEPTAVYALNVDGLAIPDVNEITGKMAKSEKKPSRASPVIILSILALVAILVIGYFAMKPEAQPTDEIESSIAVLPFTNLSQDANQDYLSAGFTSEVNHQLSKIESLSVVSQTMTRQLVSQQKSSSEIAEELKVNYILEGTIQSAGERTRLITNLTRMTDNELIWSEEFDLNKVNLIDAQIQVSTGIAEMLPLKITKRKLSELQRIPTSSALAYEFYLKALNSSPGMPALLESFEPSIRFLENAISLDENFAQAHALMARLLHQMSGTWGAEIEQLRSSSINYAKRAITLDSLLPDPYIVLGLNQNDQVSGSGTQYFAKANELDTKAGLVELSDYHMARGEYISAYEYAALKVQRDPKSPDGYFLIAYIHHEIGNYHKAIEILEKLLDQGYENINIPETLVYVFTTIGKLNDAGRVIDSKIMPKDSISGLRTKGINFLFSREWKEAEEYYLRTNNEDMDLALIHLKTGRRKSAEDLFNKSIQRRLVIESHNPWPLIDLSRIYSAMGDFNRAYEYLDILDQGDILNFPWIDVDPFFDRIRNEKRFQEYCDRLDAKKEKLRRQIQNLEKELDLKI